MLPRGRANHASPTVFAVENARVRFLAIQKFTVRSVEAIQTFTGMFGIADPARFAAFSEGVSEREMRSTVLLQRENSRFLMRHTTYYPPLTQNGS